MADYIYLLETRLSPAQQRAIGTLRTIAREHDTTIFLTGGAVRDLTGGGSIRDLDLTVQGEALKLKRALEQAGITIVGEHAPAQQLFLTLAGGVRVELASAMTATYAKPGKPRFELANITEDLRRRDFTANAMAISLNEGSYGLLMDPLNGVADIENRELRLVSNYGFIEDPSRLIRATRLLSRLGWQMEERTRQRYETAKDEEYIAALNQWNRGYETEEIFHEEDPVRILRALEAEGWTKYLSPALNPAKANSAALAELAEKQGQLQVQGIFAQSAAIAFPMVIAKLSQPETAALKEMFVRPGFLREVESLEARTREFAASFAGKEAASPSLAWKMLHTTEPNLVLSMSYSSKGGAVQTRLKTFLNDSPGARQRIPYALLQEMRITPDLPVYAELLDRLFFELMDGKLSTTEEMKAYLEPYSPPAPPPPINLRRARAKKEARPSRSRAKKAVVTETALPTVAAEEEAVGIATGLMEAGDLTGPDRGPVPTPDVPMAGKVAPQAEAPPEVPAPKKKSPPVRDAAPTVAVAPVAVAVLPEVPAKKAGSVSAGAPAGKAQTPAAGLPKNGAGKAPAKNVQTPAPAKAVPAAEKPAAAKTVKSGPATPTNKSVGKPMPQSTKKVPAKVVGTKFAPAKGAVVAKKAAPAKKALPAKKAAPARKAAPAGKVPAKKAAPVKKATVPVKKSAAKKALPAKKQAPAKAAKKTEAKQPARRR